MKTLSCIAALILAISIKPIFGQTPKPKTVTAMLFDLVGTLSLIKNNAESNAKIICRWHGKDAEIGEDLYKKLRIKTNSTIDVCVEAIKNPSLARKQNVAQKVMDDLNSMIAADTALAGFYNRRRSFHGGSSLGPDAIVSLIVGQAVTVFDKVIGTIDGKRIKRAEDLANFKLAEWPSTDTVISTPDKLSTKDNASKKPASGSTDKRQRVAAGTATRK